MKKPQKMPLAKPQAPLQSEPVQLPQADKAVLDLAIARAESAQHALAARTAELNGLIFQLRVRYEENGKYIVTTLNHAMGQIERVLASEVKNEAVPFRSTESSGAAASGGDQPKG